MRKAMTMRVAAVLALACVAGLAGAASAEASPAPSFGPNVVVFSPTMSQAAIQSKLNAIATQQFPTSSARSGTRSSSPRGRTGLRAIR